MKFSIALVVFAAAMVTALPHGLERRRFGQEQIPAEILKQAEALFPSGADSGAIATFAGEVISKVLGATDPCDILKFGDDVLAFGKERLNGDSLTQFVDILRDTIAVEKNFNDSENIANPQPTICLDATLPASPELRGILPLVDPALPGAADANTKTTQNNEDIKSGALDGEAQAAGKSVGQQMVEVIGFSNFVNSGGAGGGAADPAGADPADPADPAAADPANQDCENDGGAENQDGGNGGAENQDGGNGGAENPDGGNGGADPAAADPADPQGGGANGENLQKSTSALGGIPPPSVINDGSDRPFKVENNDSFLNVAAALTRSCDVQANQCQNKFNSGDRGDLQQGDCDQQRTECNAANAA